mmetsp:Transcript_4592/g.10811  ORF Transcript_4592/g.10811 Transcript_4592/m.10811 type:complete len:262 (-) Transcript_4592:883-1668(-)
MVGLEANARQVPRRSKERMKVLSCCKTRTSGVDTSLRASRTANPKPCLDSSSTTVDFFQIPFPESESARRRFLYSTYAAFISSFTVPRLKLFFSCILTPSHTTIMLTSTRSGTYFTVDSSTVSRRPVDGHDGTGDVVIITEIQAGRSSACSGIFIGLSSVLCVAWLGLLASFILEIYSLIACRLGFCELLESFFSLGVSLPLPFFVLFGLFFFAFFFFVSVLPLGMMRQPFSSNFASISGMIGIGCFSKRDGIASLSSGTR